MPPSSGTKRKAKQQQEANSKLVRGNERDCNTDWITDISHCHLLLPSLSPDFNYCETSILKHSTHNRVVLQLAGTLRGEVCSQLSGKLRKLS
jgi:hypothetical protein